MKHGEVKMKRKLSGGALRSAAEKLGMARRLPIMYREGDWLHRFIPWGPAWQRGKRGDFGFCSSVADSAWQSRGTLWIDR